MEPIRIVGILIFILCFGFQIYACMYHKENLRKLSKFLLMPSLAFLALCYKSTNVFLYLAIAFGYAGDILLINKKKLNFILGIICFALNHLSYFAIMGIYIFGSLIKWYFYLAAFGVYLLIAIPCIFIFRKNISKEYGLAGGLYMPLLLIELGFALVTNNVTVSMCFLPIVGSILFIISDCFLSYSNFIKKGENDELIIMSTYGLAQYCFVFGFLLFL